MTKTSLPGIAWRLSIYIVVIAVLFVVIMQAIQRPITGHMLVYEAVFTDANGLKNGDDVRMYGVQVGKVRKVRLDGGRAHVDIEVRDTQRVYDTSTLAIRYQSLAGQRYVDIHQPDSPGRPVPDGGVIGPEHTIPSFDITQLFNGLQPVLTELSPGALNHFAENVLAVIQGNGSGIGPALGAVEQLSRYVSDRQAVISTIIGNLATISGQIGGKSPHLVTLLRGLADVFTTFQEKLDGLVDFTAAVPSTLEPLNDLMATLGFTENTNPDFRRLFGDTTEAVELLGKLPGLLQTLASALPTPRPAGEVNLSCSKGRAEIPGAFQVLIAGQRTTICNP